MIVAQSLTFLSAKSKHARCAQRQCLPSEAFKVALQTANVRGGADVASVWGTHA